MGASVLAGNKAPVLGHLPTVVQGWVQAVSHHGQVWVPSLGSALFPCYSSFPQLQTARRDLRYRDVVHTSACPMLSNANRSSLFPQCQVSLWHLPRSFFTSTFYQFMGNNFLLEGTSATLYMWGTALPQDGFYHPSATAILKPPRFAGCCVGCVVSLLGLSCLLALPKTGFSGTLLNSSRAIAINKKNIQGIKKLKLEFMHSQIPKLLLTWAIF